MNTQPEAILQAEWGEWFLKNTQDPADFRWVRMAAMCKELRRQHDEIKRLQDEAADAWLEQQRVPPMGEPPMAWAHPDGRVVPASTMSAALRDGGAMRSSLVGYTIPLYAALAAHDPAPSSAPTESANR